MRPGVKEINQRSVKGINRTDPSDPFLSIQLLQKSQMLGKVGLSRES